MSTDSRRPTKAPKPTSRFKLWWVYLVILVPTLTEVIEDGTLPNTLREFITDIVLTLFVGVAAWKVRADYLRMAELSVKDELSGLFNRRQYACDVAEEVARAQRLGTSLVLAYIDADHFKSINDEHGHQAGDEAIRAIAELLKTTTRANVDRCYRVGGDEFAVLLPGLSSSDASGAAKRIESLGRDAPACLKRYGAGLSVGLAVFEKGESAAELEQRAERQMRERKGEDAR